MEIRPSADLRNNYPKISKFCKEQRKPVYLTVNGRGDTVLLSVYEYERQKAKTELLQKLLASKADIIAGRTRDHDEAMAELFALADKMIEDGK